MHPPLGKSPNETTVPSRSNAANAFAFGVTVFTFDIVLHVFTLLIKLQQPPPYLPSPMQTKSFEVFKTANVYWLLKTVTTFDIPSSGIHVGLLSLLPHLIPKL